MTISGLSIVAFVVLLLGWPGIPGGVSSAGAQSVKEKVLNSGGAEIMVKVLTDAEVLDVKPYIDAKKGKKSGRLLLDVKLKNTSSEPREYNIFGQGMTDTGGWLGGMAKAPKKGKLEPGKETTAKIRTRFQGEAVPKQIRVEVFPPM